MSVILAKGESVPLAVASSGQADFAVGLGWNRRDTEGEGDGPEFDLDVCAFLLQPNGKVSSDSDFVFYNNPVAAGGSVTLTKDNVTGAGEGDDEQIKINIAKVPASVDVIAFGVAIRDAEARRQSFGQVPGAIARLVDGSGEEVASFDLQEDSSTEITLIFGELYRADGHWSFRALGQGFRGGLSKLAASYGLNAA
ncbi:TerD family protein [Streptomyces sp. NPDC058401]|uniref:TerD family protein n=1 Tax=Streptomyces sp. NPDC058401 TaxID=3346480 RepID=UPI0036682126